MRNSFSGSEARNIGTPKVSCERNDGAANSTGVHSNVAGPNGSTSRSNLIVIERRSLFRNCILDSLTGATEFSGTGWNSVEEYVAGASKASPDVVILCAIGERPPALIEKMAHLKHLPHFVPIVVMSDCDEVDLVVAAMENGASGFMATNISIEVAAHALRLVAAGGQYFPVDVLLSARKGMGEKSKASVEGQKRMFTRRQIAVIDAVRRGKANKIIAYELNMCESTVKVHVRNIMKKLNAKNRTEIAYLATELPHELLDG